MAFEIVRLSMVLASGALGITGPAVTSRCRPRAVRGVTTVIDLMRHVADVDDMTTDSRPRSPDSTADTRRAERRFLIKREISLVKIQVPSAAADVIHQRIRIRHLTESLTREVGMVIRAAAPATVTAVAIAGVHTGHRRRFF